MPRQWAAEIAEKQAVKEVYLVLQKAMPMSRTGRPYLSLLLGDRTGHVDARLWDGAEAASNGFGEMDFIRVEGTAVRFQDRVQLHITSMGRVDEDTVEAADFLPQTGQPPDQLWREALVLLEDVRNPHLCLLLRSILDEPSFAQTFQRMPAGKSIHHARLGGLLEHTLCMCRLLRHIADLYASLYPGLLDRDLLLTAGFLHDVGKVLELTADRRFDYTDAGRLVGHVVLGYEFVSRHLDRLPDFPRDLGLHLKHLLLSHHGELEHGAPKRPKTAEAWILHFVDILDCRVAQTAELVGTLAAGGWTPYLKQYDRYFWRGHARLPSPTDGPDGDASTDATDALDP
jgi:3'-5' exoribonuclease